MRKNPPFLAVVLACTCALAAVAAAQDAIRISNDISQGWRFIRTDIGGAESPDYHESYEGGLPWHPADQWQDVNLPHTWNANDIWDGPPYYRGVGWYRKTLDIPETWKGKRIVVRFEAACMVAMVWVNGQLLGQHKGLSTPFEFDITNLVKPGANLLAVKVDNRWRHDVPPTSIDFNVMGGLYREVYLIATDPLYIVSTRVTTPQVSDTEGIAVLETEVRNEAKQAKNYQVVAEIRGPGLAQPITLTSPVAKLQPGETALVKQQTRPIRNVKLWSPDEPNLYQVSVRLLTDGRAVDDATSPLGFRWFRFDANEGFFLNGRHLKLHGVNRHDDYPGLGWALPPSRQVEDMKLVKQLGANYVRLSHYPQHPVVYDTCDKLGIFIWDEVPFYGGATILGAKDFARTVKQNLREMIRRDRNHPSVLIWSMGNENIEGDKGAESDPANVREWKAVGDLTKELTQISQEEDPTRPTAVAIRGDMPERATKCGLIDAVDLPAFNTYAGWDYTKIDKELDDVRNWVPHKPMMIGEYGLNIERGRHTESPKHKDFSEEYACQYHELYWQAIQARPYIAGSLIWVMCDFGNQMRGEGHTIPHMNQKGIMTFDRQPKDVYLLLQSQWAEDPMVYIVSHTWTQRKPGDTPIRVFSNCDAVELFHNEKSLGRLDKGQEFLWTVPLGAGDNQLRAEATKNGKHCADTLGIHCD